MIAFLEDAYYLYPPLYYSQAYTMSGLKYMTHDFRDTERISCAEQAQQNIHRKFWKVPISQKHIILNEYRYKN